jgi:outer membrane receptor protein involved in Fe transport
MEGRRGIESLVLYKLLEVDMCCFESRETGPGWIVALCLCITLLPLAAQVDTGILSGRVTDNSGLVVPGAKVVVLNTGTNYRLQLATNTDGLYVSPPLPGGQYRIEVSVQGFQTAVKQIGLNISERLAVDFTLRVGPVTETVTVEELGAVLQTETSTLSVFRTEKEFKELPNNSRLFSEIIRYSPGVVSPLVQRNSLALSNIRGNTENTVNGTDFQDNNFLLDGIQINSMHQGYGVLIYPEIEALEQYRVETSAPDARFGRSGGTMNVGYKSGTRDYHGVLFEFLRNQSLDARNFFAAGKAAFRKNQFGGTLGGPLGSKQARTFFFVSYEGQRTILGNTKVSLVPAPAMKRGDFSQLLAQSNRITIWNPYTDRPNPIGAGIVRDVFPNNVIPASLIDAAGKNLIELFPEPNQPGNIYNFAPNDERLLDQGTVKIDREFSAGSRGFIRYTQGRGDFLNAFQTQLGPPGNPFIQVQVPVHQAVASYTHVISPRDISQTRYGFTRQNLRSLSLNGGRKLAEELGIPNVNIDDFTAGLARIEVPGYPALGDNNFNPAVIAMNNFQLSQNFDLIRANHTLKLGFDWLRHQTNIFQASMPRGLFQFGNIYSVNPQARAGSGFGPADLLLGRPQVVAVVGIDGTRGLRRTDLAGYLQDDWKITRKLTLNLGLRYDLGRGYPSYEVANRLAQFDIATGRSVPVGQGSFPSRSGVKDDRNNFAPRFGIAYQATPKIVARLAYGLYYFLKPFALDRTTATNPPFFTNVRLVNDEGNFRGARKLSDGLVRTTNPNATGLALTGYDPDFILPYMQQWNFALQFQLPGEQQFTAAYVGTKGTHLLQTVDLNQPVPGDGAVNPRRRWPQHANVRMQQTRGNSNYHSLQATLVKRFSQGVHYHALYTWSHFIDEVNPDGNGFAATPIDNLRLNRGNNEADLRHAFRTTFGYELPFGRNKPVGSGWNPVADRVFGGWEIAGGLSLYGGLPFGVIAAQNTLNNGETSWADRLRQGTLPAGQRGVSRWFDVDAFTNPGFRLWGNGGRNILPGPGTRQLDFSLFKNFRIRESKRLQFRTEFYNISNTPQFNNPVNTMASPLRGSLTSAGSEASLQRTQRQIQFAFRLSF